MRHISTALLVASVFLIGWAFAPGHTNADAIEMLIEARTGTFNDWQQTLVAGIWYLLGGHASA